MSLHPLPASTLVLGGARSGKSAFAESLFGDSPALYLATGQALDGEMAERIDHHRRRRGPSWSTLEEPLDLAEALDNVLRPDRPVLVDCLTMWLSNLMHAGRDIDRSLGHLCEVLAEPAGPVVMVSNEVGMGLVPETSLGRQFRDHQGRVNQRVAAQCRKVVFVAAGLPLVLKDIP
ncbi:bifunctional adenosylcobinamide kinase/adenosylcobinamide-phosphate guanylyltransferase [Paramagnetospirillum magneticum]|uniref:Bifunctional adenosylcobalamin biosynthesis protein n=1 Tax=Paramagnetospirillum magneticum (strain ATCC 700264 / AMB-1) TaxID=342108 RepID=Q2VYU6_PARM1|nr:bifunctional adenosylcobinamide kinase/adenosylcobinamide-phosphate guanylyltransferase [Paramagnetospirillum magneticum]BAE53229.1 Adenosyl cobinamide kinase/adenosyl cobinamide phosphate guanylyltransferase [Paramagnetospirillum magneticum AMB-1]